jgi:pimeloyl-ACP methyl ester carboxylesterase
MQIETRLIRAGELEFETDVCGNGEKLALCLHGFPESKYSWRYQLPFLAEQGYTVWAPNLRGYGKSSRPLGRKNYHLTELIDDLVALTEAARSEGLSPSALLAHDWGGAIAWAALLTDAVHFDRFIPMNMPHPGIFRKRIWSPSQLLRSWYMFFFQLPWIPERILMKNQAKAIRRAFYESAIDKSRFPKEVLDHYASQALEPGALTAMLNYYRAAVPAIYKLKFKPNLSIPTLLIWGEEDSVLGLNLVPGTEKLVEDFTYKGIPNVSHWVQQEAPEQVNQILGHWLSD